ncbi:hypothetical protein BCR37DRAFT_91937 [Protomyces lactucae-debilis]|uniref:Uncharacterized protein n=1 Tax=Protomyces lactucae-debilis TaxID=2754530 RepID=A0A1Y2F713_PROLT|nr:uncharacterized protein BCR37DRAFT_91937 [Protomyces lactucae-debilis]ORY79447.1 hypothetical protein BCR37DRAFT_91937 [Protomyces lactucae-debilis]
MSSVPRRVLRWGSCKRDLEIGRDDSSKRSLCTQDVQLLIYSTASVIMDTRDTHAFSADHSSGGLARLLGQQPSSAADQDASTVPGLAASESREQHLDASSSADFNQEAFSDVEMTSDNLTAPEQSHKGTAPERPPTRSRTNTLTRVTLDTDSSVQQARSAAPSPPPQRSHQTDGKGRPKRPAALDLTSAAISPPGAPKLNDVSTPLPWGEALPTPRIVEHSQASFNRSIPGSRIPSGMARTPVGSPLSVGLVQAYDDQDPRFARRS